MRIGSLFSGIGLLELGAEWAGLGETIWQVERDEWCRRVLAKHWPNARRFDDVTTAPFDSLHADVLVGGFPCQDLSNAGHRRGLEGERSGLWRHFLRAIDDTFPKVVLVENVAGGAERHWLPEVRRALCERGYRTRALQIRAADVGAPHFRARVFVVARHPSRELGLPRVGLHSAHARARRRDGAAYGPRAWSEADTQDLRVPDGGASGLDRRRVKALGNGAMPSCAELALSVGLDL